MPPQSAQGTDLSWSNRSARWRQRIRWSSILGDTAGVRDASQARWSRRVRSRWQFVGNQVGEAGILAKRAEAEVTKGDIDAAATDFGASAALLESLGMRPALARVLLGWGQTLRRAGRTADAEPILQRSAGLFEELGLTREAKAVRTILALGGVKLAFD